MSTFTLRERPYLNERNAVSLVEKGRVAKIWHKKDLVD